MSDWLPILVVAIPPTIAAIAALVQGWLNSRKLNAIHIDIDGRLSQLLLERGRSERMEGNAEGRAGEKADAAAILELNKEKN